MTRVGIIGRGWGTKVQKPVFEEAGLDVVAVGGRDGWRTVIESSADVIVVTMPPRLHFELASAALDAGKHVICEKPMAMSVAEAEALLAVAQARPEQIAIVDHELRFVDAYRAARERIGELGPLRYIEVRYSSPSRGERSRPWTWWSDAAEGGGVWGAVGSHFIDALHYLGLQIRDVQATLATTIRERSGKQVTSDDLAIVTCRSGFSPTRRAEARPPSVPVSMTFNAVASGPDEPSTTTIHGEDGSFRLTGEELLFARRGEPYARVAGGEMASRPGNSPGGAFGTGTYALGIAIKRALDSGDRSALAPAATFEDGVAVQRVLDAARRSSEEGGRRIPTGSY